MKTPETGQRVPGSKTQIHGIGFTDAIPVVFTPDNEPYLGRNLRFHFVQIISSAMEQNAATAPQSHGRALTDQQRMACQVIPQAFSIVSRSENSSGGGTCSEDTCSSGTLASVPRSSSTFICTQKRSKSETGNGTPETRWKPIWELEGLIEEPCPPRSFLHPIRQLQHRLGNTMGLCGHWEI